MGWTSYDEETPQESLEGVSEGLAALMGTPRPHTLDGALYEAYSAGWRDRVSLAPYAMTENQHHHMRNQSFRAWRRRFITLPEEA